MTIAVATTKGSKSAPESQLPRLDTERLSRWLTAWCGEPDGLRDASPSAVPGNDVALLSSHWFAPMGQSKFGCFALHFAGTGTCVH